MKYILPKIQTSTASPSNHVANEQEVFAFLSAMSRAETIPDGATMVTNYGREIPVSVDIVNAGNVVTSYDVKSFTAFMQATGNSTPSRDVYEDWLISRVKP